MTNFQFSLRKGTVRTPELSKSSTRSLLGASKTPPLSLQKVDYRNSQKVDYRNSESLNRLKSSAEKIVQKQISLKNDGHKTNAKFGKPADDTRILEFKIQQLSDENSKLKAKHREDTQRLEGLETKISSTETLCDNLNDTLQCLGSQVEQMEGGKKMLESKLLEQMRSIEESMLKVQFLTSKLDVTEANLEKREHELKRLSIEKEQLEESYDTEVSRTKLILVSKDNIEKQLQETTEENSRTVGNLKAQCAELQRQLSQRVTTCTSLQETQLRLEKDKCQLGIQIQDYKEKLSASEIERNALKEDISNLSRNIIELERHSSATSKHVEHLLSEIERRNELIRQESLLKSKRFQSQIDDLNEQLRRAISANGDLELKVQESTNEVIVLNQTLEHVKNTHAKKEEEAAAEFTETKEKLSKALEEIAQKEHTLKKLHSNIILFSGNIKKLQKDKANLWQDLANLKTENQMAFYNAQALLSEKVEFLLEKLAENHNKIQARENEMSQLHTELTERTQLIKDLRERETYLEQRNADIHSQLVTAQQNVSEIKKQCEIQLEAKQLELTKHLKEISQRNDQEMNDIRRRCEAETRESIIQVKEKEKQKTDAMLEETTRKFEEKITEIKEDASKTLKQVQLEHELALKCLHEKLDKEKLIIKDHYNNEINKKEEQLENEFKEKSLNTIKDSEDKISKLKLKHQEELHALQEKMNRQLIQAEATQESLELQLKMLKEKFHEETKKKENDLATMQQKGTRPASKEEADENSQTKQIAVLRKTSVDRVSEQQEKPEGFVNFPKQRKKITQHEYEVATSDGKKTITKRKRTSTVMFGRGPDDVGAKSGATNGRPKSTRQMKRLRLSRNSSSPMGDLFGGRSLDPYADDPYAFG